MSPRPLTALPGLRRGSIVWDAAESYLYFRPDQSGCIVAGGENAQA